MDGFPAQQLARLDHVKLEQGTDVDASIYEYLRGYPETISLHYRKIMQQPCGNETQDDRTERVGSV